MPKISAFRATALAFAGLAVAHFFGPVFLQPPERVHAASGGIAVPHDWSHEHLVFSAPHDPQTAIQVRQDPRYRHQFYWRSASASVAPPPGPGTTSTLSADWQENLGSGAKAGALQFPARFSFSIDTANCGSAANPDYVVFNTGLAGSSSQAGIIAYYNLYSGCTGTVPEVYWQYNTGGTAATSVALSLDGAQVAFVQNTSAGSAQLVILKWSKSSTLKTLTPVTHASYRSCAAPCMTIIAMDSHTDTNSFPFYDFANDQIYVGDDNGTLYKFDGIFKGTPAADTSWASDTVSGGDKLTSPVYDSVSGNVFVGTSAGVFHSYKGASGAAVGTSGTLGTSIADAPLVDSTGAKAYVFVGHDNKGDSGVYQFSTAFTSGSGTEQTLAASTAATTLYHGTFDNIYYSSTSETSPTGNLYVCGAGTGGTGSDSLFRFPIESNVLEPEAGSLEIANPGWSVATPPACSPVTEIFNRPADWLFLSVPGSGVASAANGKGCTGACLYSFDVASGSLPTSPTAALAAAGGTSGIIIGNTSASTGASQIYFTTLGNQTCPTSGGIGGCAVQAAISGSTAGSSAPIVYIADSQNNRIRAVDTSTGIITTVAGNGAGWFGGDGGQATSAELHNPFGVAVDISGNLYIADTLNNRIRMVTIATGIVTTVAGNGLPSYSGDNGPATSAGLNNPTGVAVDGSGTIYIADQRNNRIRMVSGGTITTVAGNGTVGNFGDGGLAASAELYYPTGIAVEASGSGNLFIADTDNQRIRAVGSGIINTVAGNGNWGYNCNNGVAISLGLHSPTGVALDSAGNLYIADYGNQCIRVENGFGSGSGLTTVAGNGTASYGGDGGSATSAFLNYPTGVAVDSSWNLYIADNVNHRIRIVNSSGIINTLAGNGSAGYSGDGGLATSAKLYNPTGVAVYGGGGSGLPGLAAILRLGLPDRQDDPIAPGLSGFSPNLAAVVLLVSGLGSLFALRKKIFCA